MSVIEPIADAATGAVIARAVEPRGGLDSTGHTTERACLNCGASLAGDYCHACGQRGHVHKTLGAFVHDILHGVFHLEGKIWRTLPMLLIRPGELTRRYVEGQRMSFVSPIALFLFSVFLMFAVLGNPSVRGIFDPDKVESAQEIQAREVQALEKEREALVLRRMPTADIDRRLAEERQDMQVLTDVEESTSEVHQTTRKVGSTIDTAVPWLDEAYRRAKQNPDLLLFKMKTNAYKFSWMLIPLSLPFLWLLFPFSKRFGLYHHTVFITYSLCFMSMLAIAAVLLSRIGFANVGLLALLVPVHMYRQLRGAYSLSRFKALVRTALLVISSFIASTFFLLILLTLGVLD